MKTVNTYYVNRNGINMWLAPSLEPMDTDTDIEVRPMLIADEGKVLVKDNEIVGNGIWLKNSTADEYIEIEEPIESEEENTDENQ